MMWQMKMVNIVQRCIAQEGQLAQLADRIRSSFGKAKCGTSMVFFKHMSLRSGAAIAMILEFFPNRHMHWLDHLQKKPFATFFGRLVPFLLSVILCPQVCRWFDVWLTIFHCESCHVVVRSCLDRTCNKQICRHVRFGAVFRKATKATNSK